MKRDGWTARGIVAAAALCLTLPLVSGCLWAPELAQIAKDIQGQIPGARFDKEFSISLGPVTIGLARLATGAVGDNDVRIARKYLKGVRRLQVAIYNAESMPSLTKVEMPRQLKRLEDQGWETIVRVRDEEELVWVMFRVDEDSIDELYVVVCDGRDLVLARLRGNLERLAAQALADARDEAGFGRRRNSRRHETQETAQQGS